MMTLTAALTLVLAVAAPPTADTVLPVDRGVRLAVENERGSVSIQTWERDAVRVRSVGTERTEISRAGSTLRVRPDVSGPVREDVGFTITVPRWMEVRVEGQRLGVQVRGTEGGVVVETIAGDVLVEGGGGHVAVRTIQGGVTIRQARGRVEARAVNRSITLENVTGEVSAETTNGEVVMRGIRSGSARASTVNGDVTYDGTVLDDGRYAFRTHNGSISMTVPETANAAVSAVSYHGVIQSDFPVRLTGTGRDQTYTFTVGSGSARVELESFNGNIRLRRPR
jgi:DUF4097 and DUF4098 domain-containing protein YvlB